MIVNNNEANGGVSQGAEPKKGGCYPLGLSALLTFVGGALTIVGLSLQQRRYSVTYTYSVWPNNFDMFFYHEKASVQFGASETYPLPDCLKAPYSAAMAMAVIGAAIALLVALPLTYCATKFKSSPLRFIRPLALIAGGCFALIGAIISAATTTCDGSDFSAKYKLSIGFFLLIVGAGILLLAAFINLLQAAACPDATPVPNQHALAQQAMAGAQSPQMAFASSNAALQQQQHQLHAGGAPVYDFASQQRQQQPQAYGAGGVDGGLYGGGGASNNNGGGIYGNY